MARLPVAVVLVALWCLVSQPGRGDGPARDDPAPGPIRLDISLDKMEYPFRSAIALTITYTNTSKETIVLMANGTPAMADGFAGETFEISAGKRSKSYTIFAVDPRVVSAT